MYLRGSPAENTDAGVRASGQRGFVPRSKGGTGQPKTGIQLGRAVLNTC